MIEFDWWKENIINEQYKGNAWEIELIHNTNIKHVIDFTLSDLINLQICNQMENIFFKPEHIRCIVHEVLFNDLGTILFR